MPGDKRASPWEDMSKGISTEHDTVFFYLDTDTVTSYNYEIVCIET